MNTMKKVDGRRNYDISERGNNPFRSRQVAKSKTRRRRKLTMDSIYKLIGLAVVAISVLLLILYVMGAIVDFCIPILDKLGSMIYEHRLSVFAIISLSALMMALISSMFKGDK